MACFHLFFGFGHLDVLIRLRISISNLCAFGVVNVLIKGEIEKPCGYVPWFAIFVMSN